MFYADLHIHSKFSRACSRDCDLEHLAWWAARKGLHVVGTGDFCHPAWGGELRDKLVPAEPGLYRLRPEIEQRVAQTLPVHCRVPVRFMLSVEISTIYKRDEHTRKVHHLLYAPDLAAAERITAALGRIGNLGSDGRPILGLDSRDLLEITLQSDPGSYLVPAHAWTPWFSVLGSKSGFDAVADCYADLSDHIFAIETGLSSDPPMNWRVASLDRYTLVSNSDAHSPPALAREASVFDTELDYYAMRRALETGTSYGGTVEFFPEEGKYHLDGHRKCDVRLDPAVTRQHGGRCPQCGRPLTIGVLHRVEELADRPDGHRPAAAADFRSLIPLPEMISEIRGVGPKSKKVIGEVADLVAKLGPELTILLDAPPDELRRAGGSLFAESVARLRKGAVIREGGYDGEYGVIRVFRPDELRRAGGVPVLFDVVEPEPDPVDAAPDERHDPAAGTEPTIAVDDPDALPGQTAIDVPSDDSPLAGLDPDQRSAAAAAGGPLLIIAGPGTGKTRTLTHRIATAVLDRGVPAADHLAITFTRRAAAQMRDRLAAVLPERAGDITVTTFHGLGATILREAHDAAGLSAEFRIVDEAERLDIATELTGSARAARALLADADADPEQRSRLEKVLRERDLVDFDDLVRLPVRLLSEREELAATYRRRWPHISVDEYQDVDETQYTLLRLLAGDGDGLTAIGDPDQAIYAFRGADVGFFLRFTEDYPLARVVRLRRNYRSAPPIVAAARQAIAPDTFATDDDGRVLEAMRTDLGDAKVARFQAADPDAEAEFVASSIDKLLGGSSFHSLDSGRVSSDGHGGLSFSDIAVLYRTDAQAAALVSALTHAGIPHQKRSHDRLTARPGVADLARELRYADTAGSNSERTPLDRVRAAGAKLAEERVAAGEDRLVIDQAVELLTPLARRCGEEPRGEGQDGGTQRLLAELALGAEVDAYDPRAQAVTLLTLHAAKGLEFPIVFLTGCEYGLLPFRPTFGQGADTDDAEERRLFFVGMTRAQERLFLSYARRRTRQGTNKDTGPSRFLDAIHPSLLERLDTADERRKPRDRQMRLL